MNQRSGMPDISPPPTDSLIGALIIAVIRSFCMSIEVFLHWGFGCEYVGSGWVGIILMWFFMIGFHTENPLPIMCFAVAYGIAWLVATVAMLVRYLPGRDLLHTRYTGRPFIWNLLPTWKEEYVKQLEGAAILAIGFGVSHLNRPLGDYLMTAAAFVLIRAYGIGAAVRQRAAQLNDNVIEQKMVADRFRHIQENAP